MSADDTAVHPDGEKRTYLQRIRVAYPVRSLVKGHDHAADGRSAYMVAVVVHQRAGPMAYDQVAVWTAVSGWSIETVDYRAPCASTVS